MTRDLFMTRLMQRLDRSCLLCCAPSHASLFDVHIPLDSCDDIIKFLITSALKDKQYLWIFDKDFRFTKLVLGLLDIKFAKDPISVGLIVSTCFWPSVSCKHLVTIDKEIVFTSVSILNKQGRKT